MSRSYRKPCYQVCSCCRSHARYWKRLIRRRIRAATRVADLLDLDPPSEKGFRDPWHAPNEGKGLWRRGYLYPSPPGFEEIDAKWLAKLIRK